MIASNIADKSFNAILIALYDHLRTALMSRKYYGYRLAIYRIRRTCLECLLILGTSSVVSAWVATQSGFGKGMWAAITGGAALLASIKPHFQLSHKIEHTTKLWNYYTDAYYSLAKLATEAEIKECFTDDMLRSFDSIVARLDALAIDDDPAPNRELLIRCYNEVNVEIPYYKLYMAPVA